jgi:heme/copper-type cytochrome/quinol oxidase subunit 2
VSPTPQESAVTAVDVATAAAAAVSCVVWTPRMPDKARARISGPLVLVLMITVIVLIIIIITIIITITIITIIASNNNNNNNSNSSNSTNN